MDVGSLIVGFLAGVIASAAFAAALDTFVPAFGLLRGRDRSLGRPGPSQSDIAAEQTASIIAYWRGQAANQQLQPGNLSQESHAAILRDFNPRHSAQREIPPQAPIVGGIDRTPQTWWVNPSARKADPSNVVSPKGWSNETREAWDKALGVSNPSNVVWKEGWRAWEVTPPPSEREVEIRRGNGPITRIIPCQQNPEWNIANVYWRGVSKEG